MKFSKYSYNKRTCHEKTENKFIINERINENKDDIK
jgi:hypothetical protein